MQSVYLETTVVGHIAGRLHPVAAALARQQSTRDGGAQPECAIDYSSRISCSPNVVTVTTMLHVNDSQSSTELVFCKFCKLRMPQVNLRQNYDDS